MDQKSNKELAIETALEYTKSWNAADRTAAINPDSFVEILNTKLGVIIHINSITIIRNISGTVGNTNTA